MYCFNKPSPEWWTEHWWSILCCLNPQEPYENWYYYYVHFPEKKLRPQRGLICAQGNSLSLHSKMKITSKQVGICKEVKATRKSPTSKMKLYLMCLLRKWFILCLKRSLVRLLYRWSWRNHRLSHGRKWRRRKKAKSWHLSIRRKLNLLFLNKVYE